MAVDSLDGSELFARIARELAEQPDIERTLHRICELATQLTGSGAAAVWSLTAGDHATLQAATDEQLGRTLDHVLRTIDEGIARQVLLTRQTVVMSDVCSETRWPRYTDELQRRRLPIRSGLGFSLALSDRQLGALLLYSPEPDYFTEDVRAIASIVADHAAIALDAAIATDQNVHLREALQSNRRIGMAIGILIALHHLDERAAFDMLRVASQNTHIKLRDLAEEVILTGAVPRWPIREPA